MNPWTSPIILACLGLSTVGYGALFVPSFDGYGYAGHDGFTNAPSFLYWGGVNTFHPASVRRGSRGGPGVRGGGVHGGK